MRELGYSWQWQDNGDLRATTPVLPAVRDLGDGRSSFFNQLIAAFKGWKDTRNDPSKAITFGDDYNFVIEIDCGFRYTRYLS